MHMYKINFENVQVLPIEQALNNAFLKIEFEHGFNPVNFNVEVYGE